MNSDNSKRPKNMRAVIPSIFTVANMGFGFFSLLLTQNMNYVMAAWFIVIAICMDVLDGKVARLVRGESSFGVEIDSLSDWISFGIAPAFLIFNFALKNQGILGWGVAFFYIVCGALRLARFNLKTHFPAPSTDTGKKYFQGLPIPAAAGILASFILAYTLMEIDTGARNIDWLMNKMPFVYGIIPFLMIALSLLMVSNVRYGAFKGVNFLNPKSLPALFFIIAAIFSVIAYPRNSLFLFFSIYVVSGVIMLVFESVVSFKSRITSEKK